MLVVCIRINEQLVGTHREVHVYMRLHLCVRVLHRGKWDVEVCLKITAHISG